MAFAVDLPALLTTIAGAIVDQVDQVSVEVKVERDTGIVLFLHVAPEDLGKIIGKQGRMARALRGYLNAVCLQSGIKVKLNIGDPRDQPSA